MKSSDVLRSMRLGLAAWACIVSVPNSASAQVYSVTDLTPNAPGSAVAINYAGQVAYNQSGSGVRLNSIGTPPITSVQLGSPTTIIQSGTAVAMNDLGQVVGSLGIPEAPVSGFVWNNPWDGAISILGPGSVANGINNAGDIAGTFPVGSGITHACLLRQGGMREDLFPGAGGSSGAVAINDADQVVGSMSVSGKQHAFLWWDGVVQSGSVKDLGTLPGGDTSAATAVSNVGQVVGYSTTANAGPQHAFSWLNGTMTDVGSPGLGGNPGASQALGVNTLNQVVGWAVTAGSRQHAFVIPDQVSGKMVDLNSRIDPTVGWELASANSINDQGQIVGVGTVSTGTTSPVRVPHAFLLVPQTGGQLSVAADLLQFPPTAPGSFAIESIMLSNSGSGPVVYRLGDLASPFSVVSAVGATDPHEGYLGKGGSVRILVLFHPKETDTMLSQMLHITMEAPAAGDLQVQVTGSIQPAGGA